MIGLVLHLRYTCRRYELLKAIAEGQVYRLPATSGAAIKWRDAIVTARTRELANYGLCTMPATGHVCTTADGWERLEAWKRYRRRMGEFG